MSAFGRAHREALVPTDLRSKCFIAAWCTPTTIPFSPSSWTLSVNKNGAKRVRNHNYNAWVYVGRTKPKYSMKSSIGSRHFRCTEERGMEACGRDSVSGGRNKPNRGTVYLARTRKTIRYYQP